ncbi:hypothetical protein ACFSX9_10925 [Flavobacterium ardleyense]|uniref:Integral membrane protein n=1 Tax=Flavobacterium ardleyense TaxID=2038737 RepID=A0ABW5Z8N6_9FLAO
MKKSIDQKLQSGYPLELGKIIEESFERYKQTFVLSGIATIIIAVIMILIYVGYFGILYGFGDFSKTMADLEMGKSNVTMIIINASVGVLIGSLSAPIVAGFINVNHLAKNNKEFGLGSFFDFYKTTFFKDIFLNQLLISVFLNATVAILTINNSPFLALSLQIIVALFTIFCIPLIIYGQQNYMDALVKSIGLFLKNPFVILIAFIVGALGILVGLIGLCIGIFFTIPFYFSVIYTIYEQAIGFNDKSVIDEIGLE